MTIRLAQMPDLQHRQLAQDGDGWRWPVPDRELLETGMFGGVAGLADGALRLIEERGAPQPYQPSPRRSS
jgi:hypothetical protein